MNKYEKNVEAGIKYLNQKFPNWHESVNLKTLDLSENGSCIFCQVTSCDDYFQVREKYFKVKVWRNDEEIESEKCFKLGFELPASDSVEKNFIILTDAWKSKIKEIQVNNCQKYVAEFFKLKEESKAMLKRLDQIKEILQDNMGGEFVVINDDGTAMIVNIGYCDVATRSLKLIK